MYKKELYFKLIIESINLILTLSMDLQVWKERNKC